MTPQLRVSIVGLSLLAALALGALCSPVAMGTAKWAIEGKTLAEVGIEKESVASSEGSLSLEVPKLAITIVCKSEKASGHITGTNKGDATLELTGCSVQSKKETLPCTVKEPVALTAESEFIEHEKKAVYDILKPQTGKPLTTIVLTGEACPLPLERKVEGTAAGELGLGESLHRPITFSKEIAEAAKTSLTYGANTAYLIGSTVAELSGSHASKEWGANARTALLCEIEADPCPSSTLYPAHTTLTGSLATETEAYFEGSFGTVKCTGSNLEGETLEEEGENLLGTVSSWGFSGCKLSETGCTLTTEHLPYSTALAYTSADKGTLSMSSKGEAPAVKLECGKVISCTVSGNLNLAVEGGEPGKIVASKAAFSLPSEGTCAKATLTATYELTEPDGGAAFVAQQADAGITKLCSQAPSVNAQTGRLKCPNGQGYTGEIVKGELSAGEAQFFYNPGGLTLKEILCNETNYDGKFKEDGGAANSIGLNSLTFTSLVGGMSGKPCASANLEAGNPTVTVTVLNRPYTTSSIVYLRRGNAQGDFLMRTTPAGNVKIRMEVNNNNPPTTCTYKATFERMGGAWYNGAGTNPSLLSPLGGHWTKEAGAAVCPPSLSMNAILTVKNSTGGNLYVAGE